MRLQLKHARWQCLVASFAMALDLPLDDVVVELGHDGGEVLYPALPDPLCRRGVHPQELIDVCRAHGYAVTYLELFPCLKTKPDQAGVLAFTTKQAWSRFTEAIKTTRGVIGGVTPSGKGHAVAYEYGHIYDPDGWMYDYSPLACEQSGFFTQHLWYLDKIGGAA